MSLASSLESLRKIDINDLDLNNIGSWPAAVKVIVCVLLTAAVLALGYNFHLSDMQAQLEQQAAEEETLKQQFSTKAFQAANLEAYKAQMKEMEESFGALLRQLPSDTEVPGLLEDITRTGLGSGLEFEEIKLLPEVAQQFYIELPIQISVVGGYHDLATFVSGVSSLPRIVTLHDFEIKPVAPGSTSKLRMSILAKTLQRQGAEEMRARLILSSLLLASLAGCGGGSDFADLQSYMDEVRARPKGTIEPLPKFQPYEAFTYSAASLRSPFQPPVKIDLTVRQKGNKVIKPDETRVKQFLEGFNIETFEMVGTLSNAQGTFALVKGAGGVHRVRVGDYLGRNDGKVVGISEGKIDVIEIVPDGEGNWLERPRSLTLKERA